MATRRSRRRAVSGGSTAARRAAHGRVIPTAPRRARNRLATAVLAALGDAPARRLLERVATDRDALGAWLAPDERGSIEQLWRRASAAAAAVRTLPLADPASSLAAALAAAAALFDAGLGFEVHEALEPHWVTAEGERREALQGLIQVAVGFQHLANGNLDGGRTLVGEGAARMRGRYLDGLALDDFARAAVGALVDLAAGEAPRPPRFPR
ncbi:MAG TPA: DUF309 domain-containing protein [Methylomirabilota bacterium]|nr:DUF309 domain-containing protein [Methylomirabilota bacterium]